MTVADKALDDLARWYAEGRLTFAAFSACVDNVLQAESEGWGGQLVS